MAAPTSGEGRLRGIPQARRPPTDRARRRLRADRARPAAAAVPPPPAKQAGQDIRFTRVTFDGRLRITDLPAFRHTPTHGLGKSKAYGCGLMTLATAGGR
ncbi:type I-E CRISPR-associated protein Cas6/Cse3/CasE [Streptomyces rimosus]|uniref:type I-E CRISPR-associated protein Cas6/Cse3/CasE n=1 Tax=Streptomyces rimosus TaxID=1927 RepID=UPI0037D3B26A